MYNLNFVAVTSPLPLGPASSAMEGAQSAVIQGTIFTKHVVK